MSISGEKSRRLTLRNENTALIARPWMLCTRKLRKPLIGKGLLDDARVRCIGTPATDCLPPRSAEPQPRPDIEDPMRTFADCFIV
jgi:hypothetical protein